MDLKILLLVALCFSLFFGCAAKKAPAEEEAVPEEPPAAPGEGEAEEPVPEGPAPEEPSEEMEELADLFTVETDKPLEGEGLDLETPSSEE